jgi:hypothetical protein
VISRQFTERDDMDPNATLSIILNPATDADVFAEATANLNTWLDRNGFGPVVQVDSYPGNHVVTYCGSSSAIVVKVKAAGVMGPEMEVPYASMTLAA